MKALFKSPVLQNEFDRDGFVKVPLLLPQEVKELVVGYNAVALQHEKINIPYVTTSHSNNAELITAVDDLLQKVMAPAIDSFLMNYNLLFGNYLIKMPVANSDTSPHQDITFVNEKQFTSVNIWVALEDTDKENGCMYFLRGSHRLMPTLRPTHDYPWAYEQVKEEIKQYSESFSAKAGDAFIFNHAVVHGSFPNNTGKPRLAAVIAAYSKDAELIHYYLPDAAGHKVRKYGMTKEAYLTFVKGQPPAKGVFIKEENYDFRQLTKPEFNLLMKKKSASALLLDSVWRFFRGQ